MSKLDDAMNELGAGITGPESILNTNTYNYLSIDLPDKLLGMRVELTLKRLKIYQEANDTNYISNSDFHKMLSGYKCFEAFKARRGDYTVKDNCRHMARYLLFRHILRLPNEHEKRGKELAYIIE